MCVFLFCAESHEDLGSFAPCHGHGLFTECVCMGPASGCRIGRACLHKFLLTLLSSMVTPFAEAQPPQHRGTSALVHGLYGAGCTCTLSTPPLHLRLAALHHGLPISLAAEHETLLPINPCRYSGQRLGRVVHMNAQQVACLLRFRLRREVGGHT